VAKKQAVLVKHFTIEYVSGFVGLTILSDIYNLADPHKMIIKNRKKNI
jgi:hypothetical protein